MLIIFLKILVSSDKRSWNEESVVNFRVYPFDCDINFHLTGSRYIGLADLGRIHLLGQIGILKDLLKRNWFPFASGIEITYIHPIKPFQKFKLRSKITSWDEKYWYAEHYFEVKNKIYAIALVRGVFVKNHKIVPIIDIVALTSANPLEPP